METNQQAGNNTEKVYDAYAYVKKQDAEVYEILHGEEVRQYEGLELIPSENYVSHAVREALASGMTNKYSEGYPGRRYYGGQEYTDQIEVLAIERAKNLFGAKYANVQPLSGAPANMAVYAALLKPGDTVMGLSLPHGGHLTHGHPATFPAKMYNFIDYEIADPEMGTFDMKAIREKVLKEKPKMIIAGFSAYTREFPWGDFAKIGQEIGAIMMADVAHIAGLIAAEVIANPMTHGFDIMTTTTHKTLRGPRGGMILVRDSEKMFKKINKAVFPGLQGGPHMHQIAGKAVAFGEALDPSFKIYAQQVITNARSMAEIFKKEEVRMIAGGTDNHMLLVDVWTSFNIAGKQAQELLDTVGITLNMNMIPGDTRTAMDPSGIRFGTPAITTRGFEEDACKELAQMMIEVLRNPDDESLHADVKNRLRALATSFPIPETFV